MYKLPHKLANDLWLRILGNNEVLGKSTKKSAGIALCQFSDPGIKFGNSAKKWNKSPTLLDFVKLVSTYFLKDCLRKQFSLFLGPDPLEIIILAIFGFSKASLAVKFDIQSNGDVTNCCI